MVIYLDTSAFIKLYIKENGSEEVNTLVTSQDDPLPIWDILEAELTNALRLKVFWGDLETDQSDFLLTKFRARKLKGLYYRPLLDHQDLMACFIDLTHKTANLGCRTLDIFHVAAALMIGADLFVSFDDRQIKLAEQSGLKVHSFT
jgi:predicted nucleic acid-binding protein